MRISHMVAALTLVSAVAGAAPAAAGGRGPGPSSTPPGFGSGGGHQGFETFSHTTTTTTNGVSSSTTTSEKLPGGWDEGKADWKGPLQSTNPVLSTRPPGLGRH
jgi:hypothetical protein